MERFLLLWDEFDEIAGGVRHAAVLGMHGLADTGRDVAGFVGGWFAPRPAALRDLPTEP